MGLEPTTRQHNDCHLYLHASVYSNHVLLCSLSQGGSPARHLQIDIAVAEVGPADAEDLLQLLERCKAGLKEDGLVIIKENVCERGFVVDPVSASPLLGMAVPSQSCAPSPTSLLCALLSTSVGGPKRVVKLPPEYAPHTCPRTSAGGCSSVLRLLDLHSSL